MMKLSSLFITILSLLFSITGFIFFLEFQSMAYWSRGGTISMKWYWVGAILAYILSFLGFIIMLLKLRGLSNLEIILRYLSLTVVTITFCLTTIILVAWDSGF